MTPEQEDQVRRALAAFGEPPTEGAPLPPAVAARLDATLADLVAERDTAQPGGPDARPEQSSPGDATGTTAPTVAGSRQAPGTGHPGPDRGDELAARRRRRRARVLLAAAAVAAVAAVGGSIAVGRGGGRSDDSNATAGGSTVDQGAGSTADGSRAPRTIEGPAAGASRGRSPASRPTGRAGPGQPSPDPDAVTGTPVLHRATLQRDVERLLGTAPAVPALPACEVPPAGPGGRLIGVRFDGRRATLVLGPATTGQRTARVFGCADPRRPLAATTVPVGP